MPDSVPLPVPVAGEVVDVEITNAANLTVRAEYRVVRVTPSGALAYLEAKKHPMPPFNATMKMRRSARDGAYRQGGNDIMLRRDAEPNA